RRDGMGPGPMVRWRVLRHTRQRGPRSVPRPSARPPSPATPAATKPPPPSPATPAAPHWPRSPIDATGPPVTVGPAGPSATSDSPGAQVTFAPGASAAFLGAPRLRPPSPNSHKRLGSSTDLRFRYVFPQMLRKNVPEYQFTHAGGTPGACVTGGAGAGACRADPKGDRDRPPRPGFGGAPAPRS